MKTTKTLITKLDSLTHERLDRVEWDGALVRNEDVTRAISAKWGMQAERYLPYSYRAGAFIFNVYLLKR